MAIASMSLATYHDNADVFNADRYTGHRKHLGSS